MSAPDVIADLSRWGPHSPHRVPSLSESQVYCRALACAHYENFPVVTWLLPRRLHQHFYNVYAFCRWADDLGDETNDPQRSLELLAWWQNELDRCYAGEQSHPVFVALAPTIDHFQIPQQPFSDLISAFVQDQHLRRYETFDQLQDYCRRSANPVGRIVLYLCERFTSENAGLSDSICTGLQLANFWQDVARDFAIGRVYLPQEDRERFGYTDELLLRRVTTHEFQQLMEFEVDRARSFLQAGFPLVDQMPGRLKIDIGLFLRGGLMILDAIERIEYRVWEQRPKLRKIDFALAMIRSLFGLFRS
jgi:squalene synthase HpnC